MVSRWILISSSLPARIVRRENIMLRIRPNPATLRYSILLTSDRLVASHASSQPSFFSKNNRLGSHVRWGTTAARTGLGNPSHHRASRGTTLACSLVCSLACSLGEGCGNIPPSKKNIMVRISGDSGPPGTLGLPSPRPSLEEHSLSSVMRTGVE